MSAANQAASTGRRVRKRNDTARHLAATAFALFEAEGFETVTMEQVAATADVAKGTLYNHFPVKEALLAYQFRQEIASGMAALGEELEAQPDFQARMRRLFKASAAWNVSRRAYLPHYLRFRMAEIDPGARRAAGEEHSSGVARILEGLLVAGQRAGEVRAGLDAGQVALTIEFACLGAVTAWLHDPVSDLEAGFGRVLDVLLDGIAAPVPPLGKKR
jgi:AcrR family transcriptional regulator